VRERLRTWRASPEGAAWEAKRAALPVVTIRDALLAALAACDVAVIGGDTGCGKTTQARGPPRPARGACGARAAPALLCRLPVWVAAGFTLSAAAVFNLCLVRNTRVTVS
jgi:hypothetical protein